MPYYFDALDTPIEPDHMWELLQEIWNVIHSDLMDLRFETEEEAINKEFGKFKDPMEMMTKNWGVARFRETDDRENLIYFHEMGLEALAYTEFGIDNRNLDVSFMHYWSQLTSSHGFVCASLMALGDDMQSKRAGVKGGEKTSLAKHQQWFAHYYIRERPKCNNRAEAEAQIERLVNAITDGDYPEIGDEQFSWFDQFLSLDPKFTNVRGETVANPRLNRLTKSFRQGKLPALKMKELVQLPANDLPQLNLKVPPL